MARDDRADVNRIAVDEHGVRRFISAGDALPPGWRVEEKPKSNRDAVSGETAPKKARKVSKS